MNDIKQLSIFSILLILICTSAYSIFEIMKLKQELQIRPPLLTMDITAIAVEAAKSLKTSEERVAYVKNLEKVTHDLSDKGYVVINAGNILAAPKESMITIDDINNLDAK